MIKLPFSSGLKSSDLDREEWEVTDAVIPLGSHIGTAGGAYTWPKRPMTRAEARAQWLETG
ncbi:unnamed protein product, partial [Amoebophrya sp. A25]